MNKMLISALNLTIMLFIWSCNESDLDETLRGYEPKLVIDGSIEQDQFAFVALTLSTGYLEDVERDDLVQASELNAKITLSDGERSEVLILRRNEKDFPPFIYRSSDMKGEIGKTYELKIEYREETYLSSTTIPDLNTLDSLWFDSKVNDDTVRYTLMGRIIDDPNIENYYRVFTRRMNKDGQFIPMYLSTIADNFFNGETLDFTIFRGVQNLSETRDDGVFLKGDTVQVRFSSIDGPHFGFWSTIEQEIYSFSNPFSSSGNEVLHNVDPKAIGVWGGYASVYYTIVAK